MTIIQDYLKLTKELINNYGEKSLVLMQVGSFFECYALLEKDGSYSGSLIKEFAE
jgi:DNA mismatch repair protein MutS